MMVKPKRSESLQNGNDQGNSHEATITEKRAKRELLIGAHVSVAGGLYKAFEAASNIEANAFGLFLRNQRAWGSKSLTEEAVTAFREALKNSSVPLHGIVPHGSYLINCGSPTDLTFERSRDVLLDEMERCDRLGILYYNFHPGSSVGKISQDECISKIADCVNLAISKTMHVTALLENMSGQGSTIGGKFEELAKIIHQVENKKRIGVCFDTCHAFAAGYDIVSEDGYQRAMSEFESTIGFKYLKAVHLNDCKSTCGSHLDRHEDIGKGMLGLNFFKRLLSDDRFIGLPMILETPGHLDYAKQIKLLRSLVNR